MDTNLSVLGDERTYSCGGYVLCSLPRFVNVYGFMKFVVLSEYWRRTYRAH